MVIDGGFAERIAKKYTSFGRRDGSTNLVLLEQKTSPPPKSSYELLFQFYNTWQSYVKSGSRFLLNWGMVAQTIARSVERQLSDRRFLEGLKKALGQCLPSLERERLPVMSGIADIFVNRASRPDLAKKAEKELVQLLAPQFYEQNEKRQEKQVERILKTKRYGEPQMVPRQSKREKREANARTEKLKDTRRMLTTVERRVKEQETVITELRQKLTKLTELPDTSVKKITGEVMKQMERELHMERLRRGL